MAAKYSEAVIKFFLKNNIEGKLGVFCSVAGLRGRSKKCSMYGSAKSALISYMSGLRQKYSSYKISITTIILGFVNTKMLKTDFSKPNKFLVSDSKYIAKKIFENVQNKKDVFFPFKWRLIMFLINLIPEKFFKKLKF